MSTLQGGGYTNLSNYIKNTLIPSCTTIRAANIYDYEVADLAGFPAVTITAQDMTAQILDNTRNERIYNFTIRVFIERQKQNFGASKAETILRLIADDLIDKIDQDSTFGGNAIDVKPFNAKFGYVDRELQNIRVVEVSLQCRCANTWR
jgi:hypothetical protein